MTDPTEAPASAAADLSDPLQALKGAFPDTTWLESPSRWVDTTGDLTRAARIVHGLILFYALILPFSLSAYWIESLAEVLLVGYVGAVLHVLAVAQFLHRFFRNEQIKVLAWRRAQPVFLAESAERD